mmetsp:Transcript_3776/g.16568  ORF Transcript_3776/g.16568 Transcript_3776/m.16568 type:complete len:200 (+) Transcript_3776:3749-4348(+)
MGSHACDGSTASKPGVCLGSTTLGRNRFTPLSNGCNPPQYPNSACQQYTLCTPSALIREMTRPNPSPSPLSPPSAVGDLRLVPRPFTRFRLGEYVDPNPSSSRNLTFACMALTLWLKHDMVLNAPRITGEKTQSTRNFATFHVNELYATECSAFQYAYSRPLASAPPAHASAPPPASPLPNSTTSVTCPRSMKSGFVRG